MKRILSVVLALVVAACLGTVFAGSEKAAVTIDGQLMCAHCTLHEKDLTACQDVLVVKGEKADTKYYLVKNEVADTFGHACKGAKDVRVTGMLSEREGKQWMVASKIEPAGKS